MKFGSDFLADCIGLDNAERGMYVTACVLIFAAGGPIPRDHLRAACRSDHGHAFNRQLDRLIELGKLAIDDGQITNKRAINEAQKADKRSTNARQNGGKGGRPSKEIKAVAKPAALHVVKQEVSQSVFELPLPPSSPPHPPNNYPSPVSSLRSDTSSGGEFEEFYRAYPRHDGRKLAEKAWPTARKRASFETILAGVKRYAQQRYADCRSDEDRKKFTKLPATWLNNECWTDETSEDINGHAPTGPVGPKPSLKEILGDDYERAMALAH